MPSVPSGNFSRKHAKSYGNRLLGLVSSRDCERLRPHLQRIPLEATQLLYRGHKPIGYVDFIETGVCTLIDTMTKGAQRTGVTVAAVALQRAGLIHYRRGNVTILDRLARACRRRQWFGAALEAPR